VDIQSFFWFAGRLLNHVALTLRYFFRKVKPSVSSGQGVKSHPTLVGSPILEFLPSELQDAAKKLETAISDFRNADVEHDLRYGRNRKPKFDHEQPGKVAEVRITVPPAPNVHPEKPLREQWIEVHDSVSNVSSFLGSPLK
jgi:hypothetical protein